MIIMTTTSQRLQNLRTRAEGLVTGSFDYRIRNTINENKKVRDKLIFLDTYTLIALSAAGVRFFLPISRTTLIGYFSNGSRDLAVWAQDLLECLDRKDKTINYVLQIL